MAEGLKQVGRKPQAHRSTVGAANEYHIRYVISLFDWRKGSRLAAMRRLLCFFLLLTTGCWSAPTQLAPRSGGPVGLPHRGVLTGGKALPAKGSGFVRFRKDGIHWGHPHLVDAIATAAATVERKRPGGAPLVVADIAAETGGKIPRHRSHRTGRDADLLFYVVTPDGRPIENPGFLHFGADGLAPVKPKSRTFVRLDVERTWLLVKSLSTDDRAGVQWLFVARWLKAMLLEHAYARGEDTDTIFRAMKLLHQPSDSFSHDDHIHVRIACSPSDAVGGCRGGGIYWPWMQAPPSASPLNDQQLLSALLSPAPESR